MGITAPADNPPSAGRRPRLDRQPHVNVPAKIAAAVAIGAERRRWPADRTGTRNQPRLEQDLGAIADAQHVFPGLRRFNDRIGQLVVCGNSTSPDPILVREAARQDKGVERAQADGTATPVNRLSVEPRGLQGTHGFVLAIGTGEDRHRNPRAQAAAP